MGALHKHVPFCSLLPPGLNHLQGKSVRESIDSSVGGAVRRTFNVDESRAYEEIDSETWAALRGEEVSTPPAGGGNPTPNTPPLAPQRTGLTPKELWVQRRAGDSTTPIASVAAAPSIPAVSDGTPGVAPASAGAGTDPSQNTQALPVTLTPREKWLQRQGTARSDTRALQGGSEQLASEERSEWEQEEAEWRRMENERQDRLRALRAKIDAQNTEQSA